MPKGLTGFQKGHSRFRTDESYLLASKKISKALKGIKRGPMQECHKKRHQNNKGFIKKLGVIDKLITKHYE